MRNFRHEGNVVPCTAPAGGVVSSGGYKIGDLFGVAAVTAAEGEPFELAVAGVYTLPKAAGAITQGSKVYWSAANSNVTTTAGSNTFIGHAIGNVADAATQLDVRLSN